MTTLQKYIVSFSRWFISRWYSCSDWILLPYDREGLGSDVVVIIQKYGQTIYRHLRDNENVNKQLVHVVRQRLMYNDNMTCNKAYHRREI